MNGVNQENRQTPKEEKVVATNNSTHLEILIFDKNKIAYWRKDNLIKKWFWANGIPITYKLSPKWTETYI